MALCFAGGVAVLGICAEDVRAGVGHGGVGGVGGVVVVVWVFGRVGAGDGAGEFVAGAGGGEEGGDETHY